MKLVAGIFTFIFIVGITDAIDSSLKNAFRNDFLIGAALNASEIEERVPEAIDFISCPVQCHYSGKYHENLIDTTLPGINIISIWPTNT